MNPIYGVEPPRTSAIFALQQSSGGDRLGEKGADRFRWHVARDEGLADAARQDEGDAPAPDLLVLAHGGEQGLGGKRPSVWPGDRRRQAAGGEVTPQPVPIRRRTSAPPRPKLEGEDHADRHR